MPTYVVTKGHDALIYCDTIVEAETRQDAKRIAESVDYDGEWIGTGDMASYDDFEIDEHDGVRLLEDGETIEKLLTISVSAPERDALLTGLRRLQLALEANDLAPMLRNIFTNGASHPGLDRAAIDMLCRRINR